MNDDRIHDCDHSKQKPIGLKRNKILIVEGKDECLFFRAFLKKLDLINMVQIFDSEGAGNIKDKISSLSKISGFRGVNAMGIVRDADTNAGSSFLSIQTALKELKLPTPNKSFEITNTNPKVCVFILPDDQTNGELEDLCLRSIRDREEISCVNQYFSCLDEKGLNRARKISKSKIHVYLASQREMVSIGVAAQKGYWPFETVTFTKIQNCLVDLFS